MSGSKNALRMLRAGLVLAASCVLLTAAATAAELGTDAKAAKIDPWVFENTRAGAQAEFFVVLADQADLAGAARLKTKLAKGSYVYAKLFEKAAVTQRPLIAELELRGATYQSFYLVNAILVKGDRALAEQLAARSDVKRIDGNPAMRTKSRPAGSSEADIKSRGVSRHQAVAREAHFTTPAAGKRLRWCPTPHRLRKSAAAG